MSVKSKSNAYRVTCEETFRCSIDVIACAEWHALEIAQSLRSIRPDLFCSENDEPIKIDQWKAEPLKLGGRP